ncbi:hypothetical protein CTI12_AA600350 [Artemisia annua]|uniref:BED-type domain-containing protein n=1 Tax=Artemisia annua TaxID=35608 RepID=A0A2U1KI17_ARTAN|nr:hypothetical protein CTI12_AA600350 [Artemisia annua]
MDNPEGKARDKAWDHVPQGIEEQGKKVLVCNFCGLIMRGGGINRVRKHLAGRKGEVAPCMVVDQDVRVAIEASLKETNDERKEKVTSNVVISDDEEQEGNKGIHNSSRHVLYIHMNA